MPTSTPVVVFVAGLDALNLTSCRVFSFDCISDAISSPALNVVMFGGLIFFFLCYVLSYIVFLRVGLVVFFLGAAFPLFFSTRIPHLGVK